VFVGWEETVRIEPPEPPPGAAGPAGEPSTADLIKGIADDASTLVKQEILLARQELTEGLTTVAKASVLLVAAGLVGLYALGFLLETLAWSLEALGLPKSASFGIVAGVLLLVAGILALIGQRRLARAKVAADRAQAELRGTTADLAAEAKVAAAGVRADLTDTVRTVREEAAAAPGRVREQVEQVASRVRRDERQD
jgi:Putative Actinobacterial Holin-X, holin superfamily III